MGKNLCLDFGNTSCKAALIENDQFLQSYSFTKEEALKAIEDILLVHQPDEAILCSVLSVSDEMLTLINKYCAKTIVLDKETDLPFVNAYSSPERLGVDRLALIAAAVKTFPAKNCLVISIGTAITYNFVTASKFFRGGAISPGPRLRFESLYTQTEKLPLIKEDIGYAPLLGFDTDSNIKSGVINGIVGEIQHFINEFNKDFGEVTVVITGGYWPLFENKIKSQIFADPKFLMKGLNLILKHNA